VGRPQDCRLSEQPLDDFLGEGVFLRPVRQSLHACPLPVEAELGGTPLPSSPAGFGRFVAKEVEKWGKVVEFSGTKIKAE